MRQSEARAAMAVPDTKAIIFDCFGVLYVDSKRSLLDIAPPDKRQELDDIFRSNNYGFFTKNDYLDRIATLLGREVSEIIDYIAREHTANHELITFIHEKLRPTYRIGLLSNIGREWIDDFFSRHQLHDLFDEVVLSGEEGMTKPNAEIFQLMAARLEVHPWQCLMIDDIEANCQGAEMTGMRAVQYQSNPQLLEWFATQHIA